MEFFSLQEKHFKEVINLSDAAFGDEFITYKALLNQISSNENVGIVAIQNNQVVGYLLSEILTQESFIEKILSEKKWFKDKIEGYSSICLIKQIVVHPNHQKKGIATKLINNCLKQTDKFSELTYCLAWEKDKHTALKGVLLKNSFLYQKTIKNYWKEDGIIKAYDCVFCGKPPCKCSAEVYIKKNASAKTDAF